MMREIVPIVALLSASSYVRLWTVPTIRARRNEDGQASLLTIIAVVLVVAITVMLVMHLTVPDVFTQSLTTIITGIVTGIGGAEVTLRRIERRKGPVNPKRSPKPKAALSKVPDDQSL